MCVPNGPLFQSCQVYDWPPFSNKKYMNDRIFLDSCVKDPTFLTSWYMHIFFAHIFRGCSLGISILACTPIPQLPPKLQPLSPPPPPPSYNHCPPPPPPTHTHIPPPSRELGPLHSGWKIIDTVIWLVPGKVMLHNDLRITGWSKLDFLGWYRVLSFLEIPHQRICHSPLVICICNDCEVHHCFG